MTPDEVTFERALELLAERAARGPAPRAPRRKAAAKTARVSRSRKKAV
jgi:topoisomerase IA-like protein